MRGNPSQRAKDGLQILVALQYVVYQSKRLGDAKVVMDRLQIRNPTTSRTKTPKHILYTFCPVWFKITAQKIYSVAWFSGIILASGV